MTFPRPSASRFGRSRPPTALAVLPRVFEPSSPYSPASGNSPAPTASSTMTHARGIAGLFYGRFERRPRTTTARRLHRGHRRPRSWHHVARDQDLPDRAEPEEARFPGYARRLVIEARLRGHGRQPLPSVEARRRLTITSGGGVPRHRLPRRRALLRRAGPRPDRRCARRTSSPRSEARTRR